MDIKRWAPVLCLLAATPVRAAPAPDAAAQWSADIAAIADDANQGRLTGSPGYMRAADYVIGRFKAS